MKVYIVFEDFRNDKWDETYEDVIVVYDSPEKAKQFLDRDVETYWRNNNTQKMKDLNRYRDGWVVHIMDEHNNKFTYRSLEMEVE